MPWTAVLPRGGVFRPKLGGCRDLGAVRCAGVVTKWSEAKQRQWVWSKVGPQDGLRAGVRVLRVPTLRTAFAQVRSQQRPARV
jgi:hypothetical protein